MSLPSWQVCNAISLYFNLHSPNHNELSIFSYVYSTILYSKCFLVFPFTIKVFNLLGIYFLLMIESLRQVLLFPRTFTLFMANLSYLDLHHYLSEVLGFHICVWICFQVFCYSLALSFYLCTNAIDLTTMRLQLVDIWATLQQQNGPTPKFGLHETHRMPHKDQEYVKKFIIYIIMLSEVIREALSRTIKQVLNTLKE